MAMGADWCDAARGFMFALACIRAQSRHSDRCPTRFATQYPSRWRKLDVPDKATRVANFHENPRGHCATGCARPAPRI